MCKMKFVKSKIREWIRTNRNDRKGWCEKYKKELSMLDDEINNGNGSKAVVNTRLEEDLERGVSKKEIKKAVWDCGTDKSPGPDGFTFDFYRHLWSTIENDVVEAVRYFFTNAKILKGCNSSFIVMIPKVLDANMVKDFRPICLIGSMYMIIAKILTNRLVGVLGDIVSEVQSEFIAERQILDGPFILNEVLQWCKKEEKVDYFQSGF
nr:RNA-directed DNA polymerase, eukaryota, reverse transcriptase zinc-binding domain protein [Tanacetum cinerariifolium]